MPRGVYDRKPKTTTEDTVADETIETPELESAEGDLCGQCWPEGWPGDGDAAECSHGRWTR